MKNQLKTILLLGVLTAALIGLGAVLGKGFLVGALVLSLAMNLGAYCRPGAGAVAPCPSEVLR